MNKTKIGIFLSLLLLIGLTTKVIFRMTTDCTAHGLKYSINHSVAPIWQLAY